MASMQMNATIDQDVKTLGDAAFARSGFAPIACPPASSAAQALDGTPGRTGASRSCPARWRA